MLLHTQGAGEALAPSSVKCIFTATEMQLLPQLSCVPTELLALQPSNSLGPLGSTHSMGVLHEAQGAAAEC